MNNSEKSKLEIKNSKTGLPIAVYDGVHLHSIYNPVKEAQDFAAKQIKIDETNRNILILGFGFGYHVKEIEKKMSSIFGEDFTILVVETKKELLEKFKAASPFGFGKNVHFFFGKTVNDFYNQVQYVDFLCLKPKTIPHYPSFNLSTSFFKNFLSFNASTKLQNIAKLVKDQKVSDYILNSMDTIIDLNQNIKKIEKEKSSPSHMDQIFLAYQELGLKQENEQNG